MTVSINGDTGVSAVQDNIITADKIATGAITIADIPDGEITSAKLASGLSLSGHVLTPDRPSFMVRKTDSNLAGNGVDIVWNTVGSDNGNNYNTTTGKFTAPVSGTYFFSVFALFQGGGDDTACALQFNVNNGATLIYPYTRKPTGASYNGVSGTCILELSVNDTVHVTSHTSGTQATLFASSAAHNGFSGYLIG